MNEHGVVFLVLTTGDAYRTSNNETSTASGDIEVYSPKEVITVNNINELGIETIGEEETVSGIRAES